MAADTNVAHEIRSSFCDPDSERFFRPAAGTVYHSDGSAANVQALHNAALDGDTITLPAGTFTWSIPVTISKAIKIQGEGSGRIIGWSRSSHDVRNWNQNLHGAIEGFSTPIGTTSGFGGQSTGKETTYMLGTVTSFSGTSLTINITSNTGSGSASLWLIATELSTRISDCAGAIRFYLSAKARPVT